MHGISTYPEHSPYMGVRQRGMPRAADPDGLCCLRRKPASAEDTMREMDRDHGHGVGC